MRIVCYSWCVHKGKGTDNPQNYWYKQRYTLSLVCNAQPSRFHMLYYLEESRDFSGYASPCHDNGVDASGCHRWVWTNRESENLRLNLGSIMVDERWWETHTNFYNFNYWHFCQFKRITWLAGSPEVATAPHLSDSDCVPCPKASQY